MPIRGLNHVNIVTTDIDGTKSFYKDLLGLAEAESPPLPPGIEVHWLADEQGQPIIHLQRHDPARHGAAAADGAGGAIDHVAFTCLDFEGMRDRCSEMGVPFKVNEALMVGVRQIFVTDPNHVMVELNFRV
jgi:catechol 2,3-dioxygenase-like lactoylglutathione lyase family enzyme